MSQVVLVTGARRGLGKSIAYEFAKKGYDIILNDKEDKETKKTMKVSDITAKAGKKKVTGKLSVKGTKVTVKIGSKKAKNAKVNGKKFTFTASSKLKKGTKVTIKVTKSGYKAVTKTVKVK